MPTAERQPVYDVLRGAAILGTLGTNIWIYTNTRIQSSSMLASYAEWSIAELVRGLCNGKFLGMLAILMGVGLHLLHQRTTNTDGSVRGPAWPAIALRRNAVLAAIGLAHFLLVFWYDVLFSYALAALIAVGFVRSSDRVLHRALVVAGVFAALAVLYNAVWSLDPSNARWLEQEQLRIAMLLDSGSVVHHLTHRFDGVLSFARQAVAALPYTLLLILIGIRVARTDFLTHPSRSVGVRRQLILLGLKVCLPLTILLGLSTLAVSERHVWQAALLVDLLQRYVLAIPIALAYAVLLASAFERGRSPWLLNRLASVGRVPLTCYVGQNVLCIVIFSNWGLGLHRHATTLVILLTLAGIWIVLITFAELCTRGGRSGPLERLWRRLSLIGVRTHANPIA